ncbi:hypothetical protein [Dictyobacter formicarum]|uniref:DUF2493 domain-containing protein n=1 Tax=Dictyobacter formicarum TaxID=2778368 RepID=A0ABQ3VDQ0_9CHLR|nr:hypothetical protein [Dictyobacter formicarum]GHO84257.1 hypothetical protein KSZ_22630 [Dictyobacter formicarum]
MASHVAQLASALHAISVLAIQQSPQPLRVAVIGSRTFAPLSLVTSLIAHLPASCVVVASNTGAVDQHTLTTARRYGYNVEEHPLDEKMLEENAARENNNALVQTVSIVVAFWDGISQGTHSAIAAARQAGIPVFIIAPPPPPNTPIQNTLF